MSGSDAWTTLWSKNKYTGFLQTCKQTVDPEKVEKVVTEDFDFQKIVKQYVPGLDLGGIFDQIGLTTTPSTTTVSYNTDLSGNILYASF